MYTNHISKGELVISHHGIKGQKWGIRRFQNEDGSLTPEGKKKYEIGSDGKLVKKKSFISNPLKVTINTHNKMIDYAIDEGNKSDLRKVVNREETKKGDKKEALKTAGVTAYDLTRAILSRNPVAFANAVKDISRIAGAGRAKVKENDFIKKREKNSEMDSKTGLYLKKEGQYNEKQDLASVNPGFKNFNSNTKNNCMLCTTAYDLRQRGYDVMAQKDSRGYNFSDLKRWYPGAKYEKSGRINTDGSSISHKQYIKNTISKLTKQGNGARGNIMVRWGKSGGGHSMVYEVKNGKVIIKDGQANKIYTNPEKILKKTSGASFARLDNVKPNLKLLKKECVQ